MLQTPAGNLGARGPPKTAPSPERMQAGKRGRIGLRPKLHPSLRPACARSPAAMQPI